MMESLFISAKEIEAAAQELHTFNPSILARSVLVTAGHNHVTGLSQALVL